MYKEIFFEFLQATGAALVIGFICFILSGREPRQFEDIIIFCLVFGGLVMMLSKRFILNFMTKLKALSE